MFDVTLTEQEINYLLNILGERPWAEANAMVVKLATIRKEVEEAKKGAKTDTSS